MGVLNITPDSFHAGSRVENVEVAVDRALIMAEEGADWIDIGGESTRPGATEVSPDEEASRVIPIIEAVREALPKIGISVDTRREHVARLAIDSGADMVNDVSSLGDPGMADLIVENDCPVCLMHMSGLPGDMQKDPKYGDVIEEVRQHLQIASMKLIGGGLDPSNIVVDPGIGFGKTLEHNLSLMGNLSAFHDERRGLLLGASRKSWIDRLCGATDPNRRLGGSIAAAVEAARQGVEIIRAHDVGETVQALQAADAIVGSS